VSEPTKDDREKAERWAELHGWKKVAFDLARFRAEASEEGRLAGRREMREEALAWLNSTYRSAIASDMDHALHDTQAVKRGPNDPQEEASQAEAREVLPAVWDDRLFWPDQNGGTGARGMVSELE